MSRIDDGSDHPAFVTAVALQVLDHHQRGGTCQRCDGDGCDQIGWALEQVAASQARAARRRTLVL